MNHEPTEPCSWCGGSGDNAQHQGQSCCGGCCVHCQGTGREDGVSMEPPPRCVVPEDSPGDWLEMTQRVPAEAPSLASVVDDPALDATDGAHPAWWRGHDHATAQWRERVATAETERDEARAEAERLREALDAARALVAKIPHEEGCPGNRHIDCGLDGDSWCCVRSRSREECLRRKTDCDCLVATWRDLLGVPVAREDGR